LIENANLVYNLEQVKIYIYTFIQTFLQLHFIYNYILSKVTYN